MPNAEVSRYLDVLMHGNDTLQSTGNNLPLKSKLTPEEVAVLIAHWDERLIVQEVCMGVIRHIEVYCYLEEVPVLLLCIQSNEPEYSYYPELSYLDLIYAIHTVTGTGWKRSVKPTITNEQAGIKVAVSTLHATRE